MQHVITRVSLVFALGMALTCFSLFNVSFGKSMKSEQNDDASNIFVKNGDQAQQPYIEDVQEQLQKSRELLEDLQDMRAQASNEERKQDFYAPIMKLTKELEHAERIFKNLDVIDPEPWLRNKTEMGAVVANLDVAYDEAFPLLQDKTKSLQEAVHHAKLAVEYGKEERKKLFLKNAQSAKYYASLAQQQGVHSDLMIEGISELEDALSHIKQDRIGAAATLTEGAYLHLNSALKTSKHSE